MVVALFGKIVHCVYSLMNWGRGAAVFLHSPFLLLMYQYNKLLIIGGTTFITPLFGNWLEVSCSASGVYDDKIKKR